MSAALVEQAEQVARRAYAPYSNYLFGAVVRARDGRTFEGVNVENAAYPLGVCAEKSAIVAAVVAGCRPGDLEAIGLDWDAFSGCLRSDRHADVVTANIRLAEQLNVYSTPTVLVRAGGLPSRPDSDFQSIVDAVEALRPRG